MCLFWLFLGVFYNVISSNLKKECQFSWNLCLHVTDHKMNDHAEIKRISSPHGKKYKSFLLILTCMTTGVLHFFSFNYRGSHYRSFLLIYAQMGDFCVSMGLPTVRIKQSLGNAFFFSSPKICVRRRPFVISLNAT